MKLYGNGLSSSNASDITVRVWEPPWKPSSTSPFAFTTSNVIFSNRLPTVVVGSKLAYATHTLFSWGNFVKHLPPLQHIKHSFSRLELPATATGRTLHLHPASVEPEDESYSGKGREYGHGRACGGLSRHDQGFL